MKFSDLANWVIAWIIIGLVCLGILSAGALVADYHLECLAGHTGMTSDGVSSFFCDKYRWW